MKKQFLLITVTLFLTSLTTYGQHAVGDTFITFTNGGQNTLSRYKVTSVSPKTVTLIEYLGIKGLCGKTYPSPHRSMVIL